MGRFSLSSITDNIDRKSAELAGEDQPDPNAKSFDAHLGDDKPFMVESSEFDRTEAPKDEMRTYWRQFETTPILRRPITSFASQVVEPGYYIEGDIGEDDKDMLMEWLENSCILEGVKHNDFRNFAKKLVVQREVRGTVLVEKAPGSDDEDTLAGFKMINPETTEVITHPNQALLLDPNDATEFPNAPQTDDGDAAAYLQDISETGQNRWGEPVKDRDEVQENKIGFTKDEIIKITKDADIGDVYGTSRIETVSQRVEGMKQKLLDNDEAIASKAYPLWLFMFGTEDNPWERDDINSFMKAHEVENFHPGMKQGVRGDVSVDTISGEVSDIAEYLNFDLNYIMSVMPMPMYALGTFQEAGTQSTRIGGIAQQQDLQRQINDARRDIESKFTPAVREKAEELGIGDVTAITLKIGDPDRPDDVPRAGSNQQIIRYLGNDSEQGPGQQGGITDRDSDTDPDSDSDSESDQPEPEPEPETEPEENRYHGLWDESLGLAELQVDNQQQSTIANTVHDAIEQTRERIFTSMEQAMDGPGNGVARFERDVNAAIRQSITETNIQRRVSPPLEEELSDVYEEFGTRRGTVPRQDVQFAAQNVENATRDALESMARDFRVQIRRVAQSNGTIEDAEERLLSKYDDSYIRSRAELIATMELHSATNNARLRLFEQRDDIIGVRVANENPSTPLCSSLRGESVLFENTNKVGEALTNRTRTEFMHEQFEPVLNDAPPWHFNCKTVLEPVYASE